LPFMDTMKKKIKKINISFQKWYKWKMIFALVHESAYLFVYK